MEDYYDSPEQFEKGFPKAIPFLEVYNHTVIVWKFYFLEDKICQLFLSSGIDNNRLWRYREISEAAMMEILMAPRNKSYATDCKIVI